MEIKAQAFTSDGYIVNQQYIEEIPYGRKTTAVAGCGWIAAYNFLHALGREVAWPYIHAALDHFVFSGGALGTNPFRLYRFLRRQALPNLAWALGRGGALSLLAREPRAGIVLYRHKSGMHYVAFQTEGERCRFFNAMPGDTPHMERMADFLNTHAKKWPVMIITA